MVKRGESAFGMRIKGGEGQNWMLTCFIPLTEL